MRVKFPDDKSEIKLKDLDTGDLFCFFDDENMVRMLVEDDETCYFISLNGYGLGELTLIDEGLFNRDVFLLDGEFVLETKISKKDGRIKETWKAKNSLIVAGNLKKGIGY